MGIEKKLRKLPPSPGVYLFFGKKRDLLYIGKAANLRKRAASYFRKRYHPPRTRALVRQIKDLDYITTGSETEALIYEANLIKEKKPRYNVELKDDKSYPFLKLTVNEKFPRLFMVRGRKKDGAIYYGPYTNVGLLKKALSIIRRIFLLRSCKVLPKKVCLKAYIKGCLAPCGGGVSGKEYGKTVNEVKLFLEGKKGDLLKKISSEMRRASKELDYEKALSLREKIEALSAMWKGRKPPPALDKDIRRLKEVLGLSVNPGRIEAFDISNIHGKEAVGSMVSFFSGKPQKDEYRRFRIKGVSGIDDYDMIREVIRRRFTRILKEAGHFPNLILIDGGLGHLNAARSELNKIGPLRIPVISIAKAEEKIYAEGKAGPLKLSKRDPALKLIMRIRDEAHRFAISYHKLLRSKAFGKRMTPFQRRVYKAVSSIPPGEVRSYKWVAKKIGRPGAYRAVGHALNKNPFLGRVPCHRVVKSDGSLGGFSKGKKAKRRLLRAEGVDAK
jgi:excinuclease ABC subunit C